MNHFSYKSKFLTLYLFTVICIFISTFFIYQNLNNTNVGDVSKKHFKNKSNEREEFIIDFFNPYYTTLRSLQKNQLLIEYLSNKRPTEDIEKLFLSIKNSLPCLAQVRFIDQNGLEKIKIQGPPIGIVKDPTKSKIIPYEKLQNKIHREYIRDFLNLKEDQIGVSNINLNKEYGQITFPKQPTLRIAIAAYDKNKNKKGIIVLNICLRTFFSLLNKTTLYHVYLMDNNGVFLNHHNSSYGLLGENMNYSIHDQFQNEATKILKNNEYFGENFYSRNLKLSNNQNIKILLELKFNKEIEQTQDLQFYLVLLAIILALILFPIFEYFSKLPEFIKEKSEKEKLVSDLTGLPNRIALMQDLMKKEFENSIVILISCNNILKVQNTYGYKISNKLVNEISKFLLKFEDKNILKVYLNSYNTFSIKYKYTDENELNQFLDLLTLKLEHTNFVIKDTDEEFEILINATFGVSNPLNITNTVEELNEAENALEYALSKKQHVNIFNKYFEKSIEVNKNTLKLAKEIKKALDKDNIILNYQPIYNNRTKKIEKYEALIRMITDDGLVYPDQFLTNAKDINKYNALSYVVIDKACKFFLDKDIEFSINLSILDISNKEFQKYLFEKLELYGVGNKIVLEIVEQEGVENYHEFFEFLKKAKTYGCKIAIDDFGSGYSNFEYIVRVSEYIDYLKIDGSLIKNIVTDSKHQILVGSLKFLCDNLGIKTIAEYVENEEILTYINSIGIDYSQGFYIGKPKNDIV